MNKERQEEIIKLLMAKDVVQPCPRCSNPQFELIGEGMIPLKEPPQPHSFWVSELPVILVACKNCGYITQHAEGILDPKR